MPRVLQERGHMPPVEGALRGSSRSPTAAASRRLFAGAGFSDPQIDEVAFAWCFRDMDDYWRFRTGVAGAIASVLGRVEADELRHLRGQIADRVASFVGAGGIELPAVSLVASAS